MFNWKKGYLLTLVIAWISFHAVGNISFFHYGLDQGLPEARIVSISQDSAGFIWMASENNLYRFNGYRFKTYRNTLSGTTRQPIGKIMTLYTDSRGILWAGTSAGLACYDYPGDQFLRLEDGWQKEDINDISEDNSGILWMATNRGLARVDPKARQTVWYTDSSTIRTNGNNILPAQEITRVSCQDDGRVWFSDVSGGLFLFDPVSLAIEDYSITGGINFKNAGISKLQYSNKRLFISTYSQGFLWFNPDEQVINKEVFSHMGYTLHHFRVSSDSVVWLAGNNGLFRFNYQTRSYTQYTEVPGDPISMNRTAINFIYEDREKNLWISSGLRGVDYGLTNTPFRHLTATGSEAYQLTQPEVTAIEFDGDNNMWLGYEGGFLEKHNHESHRKIKYYPSAESNSGKPGAIFKILSDSKNRIWFGGWESGLQKLNPAGTAFSTAPMLPDTMADLLKTADIRGMAEDSEGNLWIAIHGYGIGRYEPETYKMELFRHDPQNPDNSLSNDWTLNLCFDKEGLLWIATAHGVSRYNTDNKTFENFYHNEEETKSLSSNTINTIYCDPAGMVWAGTDKGINAYIPGINAFVPISGNVENASYSITDIRSTNPGEIWASTQSGLLGISWSWDSLQEGLLVNTQIYGRRSGLLSAVYFHRSSAISGDGNILFGGNEGIDFFNPQQASEFQTKTPEIRLTELTVDGLPVPFDFFNPDSKALTLNHQNRMISIRFAAPAFSNPVKLRYRYRMERFENQWNYTQSEQVATYTNLPPGKYTFNVEVEDRNGDWQQESAYMSLIVKPPFWKTLPFYVFLTVAFLSVIFIFIYARSRIFLLRQQQLENIIKTRTGELLLKNSELEKINQTKNKLFSIISHDLRSPFAGVLGILELLADDDSDIEDERKMELLVMAKNSAENTFELLENLLTWAHSQMKKNVSRPAQQNIVTLLNKNIELRKPSAQQKEIEIHKDFPDSLNATFDRDMINTVIRNLLNNAVKFTHPGGKIEVSASRVNGEVKVRIADTGIGIHDGEADSLFHIGTSNRKGTMGEKGTGLGLIICREFIEKNNGRIGVAPNNPKGTVFYFTLPAN